MVRSAPRSARRPHRVTSAAGTAGPEATVPEVTVPEGNDLAATASGVQAQAALDEVPEDLRLCARTLGASRLYTLARVQIRAALPGILTGMRISMAGAWTSIVAAELIAATSGLGYLIMQAGDYLNTALVFSGILSIAILGLVLDASLRGLLLLADPSRRG